MNAFFIGLTLVAGAPGLKGPVKGEPPPIVGKWMLTDYLQSGANLGFSEGTYTEFRADGKRIWCEGTGQEPDESRGYKLHEKTNPPALDLIRPNDPMQPPDVFPCIYKIDGDTLIVTINDTGQDRPTKHEEGWRVMKYKRAKKD